MPSCGVGACAPFGRDWHSRGYSPALNFSAVPLVLRWKKRLAMGMAYGLVASSLAPATRVAVSDPEALIGSNHTSITRGRRRAWVYANILRKDAPSDDIGATGAIGSSPALATLMIRGVGAGMSSMSPLKSNTFAERGSKKGQLSWPFSARS